MSARISERPMHHPGARRGSVASEQFAQQLVEFASVALAAEGVVEP